MFRHDDIQFSIFFGDRRQSIDPHDYRLLTASSLCKKEPFSSLKDALQLSSFVFLHQVHKAEGYTVVTQSEAKTMPAFLKDGDYLITDQPTVGLALVTADCLPIVYVDPIKKVVAIAHAGWRGSVAGIATNVVAALQKQFGSVSQDIQVFFGPAAKQCCYEVDQPFLDKIGSSNSAQEAVLKKNNCYYFDLSSYALSELVSFGLCRQQIVLNYNICTICTDIFCSYRRQKGIRDRQVTVVSLK